jgi:hypothetical protein
VSVPPVSQVISQWQRGSKKGLDRVTVRTGPHSPPMSGAFPNLRRNELDLAVDEAMKKPHARKSLPINICELGVWIYVPLLILVDHYWLRSKATR